MKGDVYVMSIYFVILHYQNLDDTVNCIKSIKQLKVPSDTTYNIILIDNCSPNKSGIKLKDLYVDDNQIDVILLDKNYGFSKANNIGYKLAKERNANVIMVLNNDIIFEDENFLTIFANSINNSKSHIIVPDVINFNDFHQNPMKEHEYTLQSAIKNYFYKLIMHFLLLIPFFNKYVYNYNCEKENKFFDAYYRKKRNNDGYFVPIGAFLIYTNKWIKEENISFPSNSFMYCEEDFLIHYIKSKKYIISYNEKLKVRHLEGRSTNTISINRYKLLSKKFKYQAKALCKYIVFIIKEKIWRI